MPEADNFSKLLEKLLSREDLDPNLVKEILQIELERTTIPVEVQVAKLNASNERRKPWFQWIPWAGLFTVLGGVVTAIVTGAFDYVSDTESQSHEIRIEALRYESSVFDKLLVINDTPPISEDADPLEQIEKLEALKHEERRNRICLAASFGLIRVPDYLIVAEPTDRQAYKDEIDSFLSQYGCTGGEIPTALPSPSEPVASAEDGCPLSTLEIVRNRLAFPENIDPMKSNGDALLNLAIIELNKGIHEVCNSARVGEYWATLGLSFDGLDREIPWASAFLAWLISETGNVHDLQLSAQTIDIWRSALRNDALNEASIAFSPAELQPRRGDIIFLARGSGPFDMDALRSEVDGSPIPTHNGIVYSATPDQIRYIGGNVSHMVRFLDVSPNSDRIIGYIRP